MEQREKLIKLLDGLSIDTHDDVISVVDWLLANGVVVLPCKCENCENSVGKSLVDGQTFCLLHEDGFNGDDFCSYAKRKGGDE